MCHPFIRHSVFVCSVFTFHQINLLHCCYFYVNSTNSYVNSPTKSTQNGNVHATKRKIVCPPRCLPLSTFAVSLTKCKCIAIAATWTISCECVASCLSSSNIFFIPSANLTNSRRLKTSVFWAQHKSKQNTHERT